MNLPLPKPGRSRPAWQVLRALNQLAGPDWTWRGQPEHIAQLARVPLGEVLGHCRALAADNLLDMPPVRRDRLVDTTHISITWRAHPRAELRAMLALIDDGQAPAPTCTPCAAVGIGRARCELEAGHTGPHIDGGHPALRRGEILSWEKG